MPGHEYRLTPKAQDDLEEIWLFTHEAWSIEQADRYIRKILTTIDKLAKQQVPPQALDCMEGYWKFPVGSHTIFFRRSVTSLDVIRILHNRMDILSGLDDLAGVE